MKKILVEVDTKGGVKLQTQGYVGESCRQASRFLEKALGRVVGDDPTDELYQTEEIRTIEGSMG